MPTDDQTVRPRNPNGQNQHTKSGRSADIVSRPRWGNDTDYTLRRLARDDRELHGLLVKHRPSPSGPKGGRPKEETVNKINGLPKRAMGTSRAYIEAQTVESTIRAYAAGEIKLPEVAKDTRKDAVRYVDQRTGLRPYTEKSVAEFLGWTQQRIADEVGVSRQYVTEVASKTSDSDKPLAIPSHVINRNDRADFRKLPEELREL